MPRSERVVENSGQGGTAAGRDVEGRRFGSEPHYTTVVVTPREVERITPSGSVPRATR